MMLTDWAGVEDADLANPLAMASGFSLGRVNTPFVVLTSVLAVRTTAMEANAQLRSRWRLLRDIFRFFVFSYLEHSTTIYKTPRAT